MDQIRDVALSCEKCVAVGDTWVHLRIWATCGRVGCCDSSKNRHADRHAHRHPGEAGHPIARSKQPGENKLWCYADVALARVEVP